MGDAHGAVGRRECNNCKGGAESRRSPVSCVCRVMRACWRGCWAAAPMGSVATVASGQRSPERRVRASCSASVNVSRERFFVLYQCDRASRHPIKPAHLTIHDTLHPDPPSAPPRRLASATSVSTSPRLLRDRSTAASLMSELEPIRPAPPLLLHTSPPLRPPRLLDTSKPHRHRPPRTRSRPPPAAPLLNRPPAAPRSASPPPHSTAHSIAQRITAREEEGGWGLIGWELGQSRRV